MLSSIKLVALSKKMTVFEYMPNTQIQIILHTLHSILGWGGGITSYLWHSPDVRAEWPPFSVLPGILISPFFQQKKKVYD